MYENFKDKLIAKHIIKNIGTFYYYQNFIISEIDEGTVITLNEVLQVSSKYTKKYYGNLTPFVYIANRVHSYSLEPTVHFKTAKMFPNAKGYGIVIYNSLNEQIAKLEQTFLNIPTQVFDNLNTAIQWAESLVMSDD
ncbi:hypothetical protein [Aquimarina sp. AU474]|uniref:hypothetical protein n=1 Tax=Aquimarina sp. AU474 TaxID=2108529 RepID=UPI000D68EBB4|nr:hypothetical protein [Aquimarina sp. AU474]